MQLVALDWAVVAAYLALALAVGVRLSRRAGKDVDEFFLSGRTLPWWVAGTSMVATSFAADTPLVVTGWVRDAGIWKNWIWWCYAASGFLGTFLFARWWRRGGVMTTAELAELRYGGRGATALRGFVGGYHAFVKNELVLAWVLLAAVKILDVLTGLPPLWSLVVLCGVALAYSTMAGLWGVVVTDLLQFGIAVFGALFLAAVAWRDVGGMEGLRAATAGTGALSADTLAFLPAAGPGGPLDASFWTTAVAALAVYLGVQWWAFDNVDGGPIAVQRIAAAKDERHGVLAFLWFNVAHYALRPWPWILVALASLAYLRPIEVASPLDGVVTDVSAQAITVRAESAGDDAVLATLRLDEHADGVWRPVPVPGLAPGRAVERGEVLARTDSERAYPAMMATHLPVGLLGLVVASLLAAFMSTVDTHVNLASSFFVNDLYRRFVRRGATSAHYVLVARLAGAGTLALGALVAWQSDSIASLFVFFLTLMSGVGPVYVLRWLWWRVRASTEIAAMVTSGAATVVLGRVQGWPDTPLSPGGELSDPGRILLVASLSLVAALVALLVGPSPDPRSLTAFYRRVRPMGLWGPVRALCPDVSVPKDGALALLATAGGLAATFGALFGTGYLLLEGPGAGAAWCGLATAAGAGIVVLCLPRLTRS